MQKKLRPKLVPKIPFTRNFVIRFEAIVVVIVVIMIIVIVIVVIVIVIVIVLFVMSVIVIVVIIVVAAVVLLVVRAVVAGARTIMARKFTQVYQDPASSLLWAVGPRGGWGWVYKRNDDAAMQLYLWFEADGRTYWLCPLC